MRNVMSPIDRNDSYAASVKSPSVVDCLPRS